MKATVVFILLFQFSFLCYAQQEMETDRPDQTECTSIVPVGSFQVETGFVFTQHKFKEDSVLFHAKQLEYGTTLIRIGIFKNAEFRLEAGEYQQYKLTTDGHTSSIEGFIPFEIGTKIHITEEKGILPQTVFIGHLELPIGSNNLVGKNVVPTFRFSMSNTLTKKISLGYNVGMEWEQESSIPNYVYTGTIGLDLSEKFGCYVESFGNFSTDNFPETYLDGGLTFSPMINLMFDVSGGIGLNDNSNDYYLSAGFSFRLPK